MQQVILMCRRRNFRPTRIALKTQSHHRFRSPAVRHNTTKSLRCVTAISMPSPSSAWTSPGITSKSTRSLATTEPNFFVMPFRARAGGLDCATAGPSLAPTT